MLRLPVILATAAAIVVGAAAAHVRAARDDSSPASASRLELVVFEVRSCLICSLVHQHIHPLYQQSPQSRTAPMRFVDLNEVDEKALGLTTPITTVPTIVLMEEGREVARLTGYTGPEIFFQALGAMLARAE